MDLFRQLNNHDALLSAEKRFALYKRGSGSAMYYENPLFNASYESEPANIHFSAVSADVVYDEDAIPGNEMRLKDFLASIPNFLDFSDEQLRKLEEKAEAYRYVPNEIICKQGDPAEHLFVIRQGSVDILIMVEGEEFPGTVVNRMKEGQFFGEKALLAAGTRGATVRAIDTVECIIFSRANYEEILSGSNVLIGMSTQHQIDWSRDNETRSLYRHLDTILHIYETGMSEQMQAASYAICSIFTPELSVDEVIFNTITFIKTALKSDRVGIYVLTDDGTDQMVFKMSERSKGVRMAVKGIPEFVVDTLLPVNVPDACLDARFDQSRDKKSNYVTKQLLAVPVKHPILDEAIGVLQVNNRQDNDGDPYSAEQQKLMEVAAEHLSELLHGRVDEFINAGIAKSEERQKKRSFGHSGSGEVILPSCEIHNDFSMHVTSLELNAAHRKLLRKERMVELEISVSIHFALQTLSGPKKCFVDVPEDANVKSLHVLPISLNFQQQFLIKVRDLPRATRVLFRVGARKKKDKKSQLIPIGWAAANVFDFMASMEDSFELNLFDGDNEVPINTTLSNFVAKSSQLKVRVMPEILNDALSMESISEKGGLIPPGLSDVFPLDGNGSSPLSMSSSSKRASRRGSQSPRKRAVSDSPRKRGNSAFERTGLRARVVHQLPISTRNYDIKDQLEKAAGMVAFYESELLRLQQLSFNPMSSQLMTDGEKQMLWNVRYGLLNRPELLPGFILSVDWKDTEIVEEFYELLTLWERPTPKVSLQLLDRRYLDPKIRAYAVHCLEELGDDELGLYMLQLCQQLKFESYIDSALARFLLRRGLLAKRLIGHMLYWFLQSEVHNEDVQRRFSALLQMYISHCGDHRIELGHQMFVMKRLERVAEAVKVGEKKSQRKAILKEQLQAITLPPSFQLPLNPKIRVVSFDIDRCRVMESKKKPLWLTMKDCNGNDLVLMLKVGDDLRQDALVLQLLRVMYDIWKKEGLDMQMQLYDCISTGNERGLLQVILNASTIGTVLLQATDGGENKDKPKGVAKMLKARKLSSAYRAINDYNVIKNWVEQQIEADIPEAAVDTKLRKQTMEK
jgi:CRP-like cAMP-binding protein